MATIEKIERQRGYVYKAKIRKQGHKTQTRTFNSRSAASRWAKKQESLIEQGDAGLITSAHQYTFNHAVGRFKAEVLPELTPETSRKYTQHLDYWVEQLGHLRLIDVRPDRIAAARDSLRGEGKTASTVNRYLATLGSVFKATVQRWHWVQVSPMTQVAKLSGENKGTRFLSSDELKRLLAACKASQSPDLLLAVLLALTTGARQGELLSLCWRDVDLESRVLRVRVGNETLTKGGIRSLPITDLVYPLLKIRHDNWRRAQKLSSVSSLRDPGLIFPSKVSKMQPIKLHRSWKTALRTAQIENFRWHDLRHTCASFLAKNGASLTEIGAVLGHKSANTTNRYTHLTEQHSHKLLHNLDANILADL